MSKTPLPLIFGISGLTLTPQERKLFTSNPILGFILFQRNIQDAEQLKLLVTDLKTLGDNIIVMCDQEGGRVQRLRPPLVSQMYPTAETLALEGLKAIEATYQTLTAELQEYGIDSPLAPVCDLRHPEAHDVIGDRSFGDSVEKVVACAYAAIKGIEAAEGIACIKHAPGHGRATVDSHTHLPTITTSITELERSDFAIFRQLSALSEEQWHNPCMMTAHIVIQALDEEKPATLSKPCIQYIRDVIGFAGTIITDAIEMLALHGEEGPTPVSLATVAQQALGAGCDIVLHCTGHYDEMVSIIGAVETFVEATEAAGFA